MGLPPRKFIQVLKRPRLMAVFLGVHDLLRLVVAELGLVTNPLFLSSLH